MAHTKLLGHDTWYRRSEGRGTVTVLLHGGLSSSASLWRSLGKRLARRGPVAVFDRRGHGRTADTDAPFSYDTMADETIAFLEFVGGPCHLVGYSDGGIVALLTALRRPDLVSRLVLVGANYHVDGLHPLPRPASSGPEFDAWVLRYAEESPLGADAAPASWAKGWDLFAREPRLTRAQLAGVTAPTLVMSGDDDVVRLEHSVSLFQSLPDAQLAVVPGTSHALLKERPRFSSRMIWRFLHQDLPPVTWQPIRRRNSAV